MMNTQPSMIGIYLGLGMSVVYIIIHVYKVKKPNLNNIHLCK